MRKIVKNIFIMTASIFLIFSMVFTLFQIGIVKENLQVIEQARTQQITGATVTFPDKAITSNYYYGMHFILSEYIFLFIVSFILGVLIGLILSLKENSKVKYILFFIVGNMIYTSIWLGIQQIVYRIYHVEVFYNLSTYVEAFQRYFLSYVLVWAIIVVARFLYNKYKVKQLNETLMQNRKETIKEKIPIFILGRKKILIQIGILILLIIVIIGGSIIGRRSIVLIQYDKIASRKYDNYHTTIIMCYQMENEEIQVSKQENYYKEGILKSIIDDKTIMYTDFDQNKTITIQMDKKQAIIEDTKYYISNNMIHNFFYVENAQRIWSNILLAFQVSVFTEKANGIECDVIQRDEVKIYLDKENHMPIKQVVYTEAIVNGEKKISIGTDNYEYEIGTVTDEDIKLIDLTGYEIQDTRGNISE